MLTKVSLFNIKKQIFKVYNFDIFCSGFPKISTLKVLHLCQNEFLSILGKRSLSGLSNLEELRICDNIALTEIDSMALAFPISDNGANVWPNVKKVSYIVFSNSKSPV